MKKLVTILFAFTLFGCAELSTLQELFTVRPNPITPEMLYEVESGMIVAVTGLNVYKKLCIRKVIDQSCRGTVEHLQSYTKKAKPVLVNLHKFVNENDQVNALTAYKTIKQITEDLKRETPTIGVQ